MKKTKTVSISCSDRQMEMVEDLKQKFGYTGTSAVFHVALQSFHSKAFPEYALARTPNRADGDPETVAKRHVEIKLAKDKVLKEKQAAPKINICKELGGEIITNALGEPVGCKYFTHDVWGDYEQQLPLENLGQYAIDNQFTPDKKTVLNKRPELIRKLS